MDTTLPNDEPIPLGEETPARPARYLNHFRLDKAIASGGMGEVYLGYDTSLQRPVALKVIRPELARNPAFADRFLREARAQAQISHSNVVQVYFVGQEGDVLFMAMELVDGGSLSDQLHSGKKLDWRDALKHMRGLAEGLSEAARLSIVHRDIKPANVLLDRFGLAHLADFGLAAPVMSRDQGEQAPVSVGSALPKLTRVGTVMGSPPYMSPEQAKGDPLDVRADIYSLGASFYELMCGEPPTKAETFKELTQFLIGPPPMPLSQRMPDVPPKFARLIDRCMERDKALRFQSYDELLKALDEAQPRPQIPGSTVQRLLAWSIDLTVFAAATRLTFSLQPLLGFVTLVVWLLLGLALTGSTPGQWMMRLSLRRPGDLKAGAARGLLRGLLQHGWLALATLAVAFAYHSGEPAVLYGLAAGAALLFVLGVVGSLLALFDKQRRTLVDRLSGTQVLVDVR
ncbi:MAG: protein kinase [Myxococcaceae bacterium]